MSTSRVLPIVRFFTGLQLSNQNTLIEKFRLLIFVSVDIWVFTPIAAASIEFLLGFSSQLRACTRVDFHCSPHATLHKCRSLGADIAPNFFPPLGFVFFSAL